MNNSASAAHPEQQTAPDRGVLCLDLTRVLDSEMRHPVAAEFSYSKDSPFVVTVVLRLEDGPAATWRIGRDVLFQGLSATSGVGDVQVWPAHLETRQAAWLRLASRGAVALFEVPVPPLARWLERTYRIVPGGTETEGLDWDGLTADLLQDPDVPSG